MNSGTRPAGVAAPARDGRDRRWDDHRTERRRSLVEATLRAVRQHGSGAGMDEIAAVAGTSKTVLYRHFGDKGQLYLAVTEAVHALIARDLHSSVERAGATDARGAVAAAVDADLARVERDPEVYRVGGERPLLAGGQSPDGADPVRGLVQLVAHQVGETLAAAGAPADRSATWGHALVGMVRAVADEWIDSPSPAPRHVVVEHLVDLAWEGLGASLPQALPHPGTPTEESS
jgi:AcrR family transcriptional regulator